MISWEVKVSGDDRVFTTVLLDEVFETSLREKIARVVFYGWDAERADYAAKRFYEIAKRLKVAAEELRNAAPKEPGKETEDKNSHITGRQVQAL